MNGRQTYRAPTGYTPTEEHIAFCMQFLVTTALRLATTEAQLAKPSWIDGTTSPWQTPWQTIMEIVSR